MKRLIVFLLMLLLAAACFAQNDFGLFFDGGIGYTSDENIGLGFVNSAKGFYFGVGTGIAISLDGIIDNANLVGGVNIDFLGKPMMEFVRGQEHYDVENLSDQVSLRVMPYIEISKSVVSNLYLGFGVGYGFTNLYFGMPPQIYDINITSYNSYKMTNHSITPVGFVRYYLGSFYFTLNYECDIVLNGNITKLNGDPFTGDVNGEDNIKGIHHRIRLAVGYTLGFF
ncbi:hypothetical protein LQZ21_12445 [Treponema sp. TIM-1]|uniref:hypothetical protein n=1 Tax=Treponema sp. TIM-1 TaxID=2898417 RepID=UPI003980DCC8